jgi:hypothetical protein
MTIVFPEHEITIWFLIMPWSLFKIFPLTNQSPSKKKHKVTIMIIKIGHIISRIYTLHGK